MNEAPTTEQDVLEALARVPVFSPLDERNRRKLAKLCTFRSFDAGDVLYEDGAMGLGLFIVTEGRVEIYKNAGDTRVSLGTVGPGGMLGQLALIDDQPRAASAAALERTECLLVTRDSFLTLVKKEPQIAWCLTPDLAGRIRELQQRTVAAELARERPPAPAESAGGEPPAPEPRAAEDAESEAAAVDEEEDGPSEMESALFKMMRMQFGMMAGAAKGMTETSRALEKFLDSMADESDFKTSEDWSDLLGKMPEAMATATRVAMEECEEVPEQMVKAYRRYQDSKE